MRPQARPGMPRRVTPVCRAAGRFRRSSSRRVVSPIVCACVPAPAQYCDHVKLRMRQKGVDDYELGDSLNRRDFRRMMVRAGIVLSNGTKLAQDSWHGACRSVDPCASLALPRFPLQPK